MKEGLSEERERAGIIEERERKIGEHQEGEEEFPPPSLFRSSTNASYWPKWSGNQERQGGA